MGWKERDGKDKRGGRRAVNTYCRFSGWERERERIGQSWQCEQVKRNMLIITAEEIKNNRTRGQTGTITCQWIKTNRTKNDKSYSPSVGAALLIWDNKDLLSFIIQEVRHDPKTKRAGRIHTSVLKMSWDKCSCHRGEVNWILFLKYISI